jgi:hypothetical protein
MNLIVGVFLKRTAIKTRTGITANENLQLSTLSLKAKARHQKKHGSPF